MSIELLPLSDDLKGSLHSFGVHYMGQVASLSRDILTDRFGREGSLAWELCSGIDRRPVVPIKQTASIVEYASLPFSSTSIELLSGNSGHSAATCIRQTPTAAQAG